MKIRRIVAADMRKAMSKVREELGADAVILSTKKVPSGTEIVAAVDYDEQQITSALTAAELSVPSAQEERRPEYCDLVRGPVESYAAGSSMDDMRSEIRQLRDLMENQIAMIGWNKWSRKSPQRAGMLKKLTALGLGGDLSNEIINQLKPQTGHKDAWRAAMRLLCAKIKVTGDDILTNGGVVALIGATGVGKTTTVAKLAARFALRHGKHNVALVSTDNYRIGALDHLLCYGRILEVPVLTAASGDELIDILRGTRHKKLVVIDTAGMSHRDMRLTEQLATLRCGGDRIKNYLVMSANTQTPGLNDIVRAFSQVPLQGCIITKEDEAMSLGGALTVLARYKLPVAYMADGQRVPEDLHPARADLLVKRTVALAKQARELVDDESMAIEFGGMVVGAGR